MDWRTITPQRIITALYSRLKQIPLLVSWHLQSDQNIKTLLKYRDAHKGERCFIIGNGPSLKNMDLTLLKNEVTFGMNRIYLLFNKMGFKTTYHVVTNSLVVEQFLDEIKEINVPSFVPWKHRKLFTDKDNYSFMFNSYNEDFSTDITKFFGNGATVTYNCLHLAYYMGFKEVYLIGIDHNFPEKGIGKVVTSSGEDKNHFDPNYFGKGIKWGLANLPQSERAYKLAKNTYEKQGRDIFDATINGKLDIFDKIDFYSLFSNKQPLK